MSNYIGIKFIGLTIDEICESQDFSHEDEFILKSDAELEIEKLKEQNTRLQNELKEAEEIIEDLSKIKESNYVRRFE